MTVTTMTYHNDMVVRQCNHDRDHNIRERKHTMQPNPNRKPNATLCLEDILAKQADQRTHAELLFVSNMFRDKSDIFKEVPQEKMLDVCRHMGLQA